LARQAFFNYFPYRPNEGGVTVVSGDFKLIRWFGPGTARELYNLKQDISESNNLADAMPDTVQQLDALIDGFLSDTGALVPKPNPAYKPAPARPANNKAATLAADPLEGWKARQCEAVVAGGVLTMTGKSGAAFLGHAMGRAQGPANVTLRLRSASGGEGKVEWLGDVTAGVEPKFVTFNVPAGDWAELTVPVPAQGLLGTTRLYLPTSGKPLELDWVEVTTKGAKPQRWEFNGVEK
jgi:hypothetical protein